MFPPKFLIGGLLLAVMLGAGGCASLKNLAVDELGNGIASGGTTFAADDDPDLIKAAVPSNLKLIESLLAMRPEHPGLLLAATSGFTQYSYAFVQEDADELESKDYAAAKIEHDRAKRLYLRARNYGLRGLDVAHPHFSAALMKDPLAAAAVLNKDDVPQIYWTAAAWGAALSLGKDDPVVLGELPQIEALIDRAAELDESWNSGAIHTLLISYEMIRQGGARDAAIARARKNFERAVELSAGGQVAPYVTYAESVCVATKDATQFEKLLQQALAINPDDHPETRLTNLILQRRARWLLDQKDNLFLPPAPSESP